MSLWWAILGALLAPVLPGYGLPVLVAALAAAAPPDAANRQAARVHAR
jgi:hypothetical protein